jgi:hypothetical protein
VVGKHKVTIMRVHQDNSAEDQQKRSKPGAARKTRMTSIEFEVPAAGTKNADFDLGAS